MDNFAREIDLELWRRGPSLLRKSGAVFLTLSLLLSGPAAPAAEFEIAAASFTVVNQVNISSVTYYQTRAIVPPDPALATQLLTPGGLYFDATYYNVWDRNALAWVKLATGTVEAGRVAKAGDFMSGQLTTASTITVQGDAFSVGGSTFVVAGGKVGVGTNSPGARLEVRESMQLGGTAGVSQLLTRVSGVTSNVFMRNLWLYRDSAGTNWLTARLHDGISVDGSFLTPGTDTRTWWERDPNNDIQSWGSAATPYLTINAGKVGIGTTAPATTLDVNGNAQFGSGATKSTFTATGALTLANQTIINGASLTIPNGRPDQNGNGIRFLDFSGIADARISEGTGNSLALEMGKSGQILFLDKNLATVVTISTVPGGTSTSPGGAWVLGAGGLHVNYGMMASTGVFTSTMAVEGNAFSVGGSTLVVIGGNVGIGTTSPQEALEVNGTIKLSGGSPTYRVTNVASPIAASDVATKAYVDAAVVGVQYMGLTGTSYNGILGGIPGANGKCNEAYAGSHFCHLDEVYSTSTMTFTLGWIRSDAVPRYTTTPSLVYDCRGGGQYQAFSLTTPNNCFCFNWGNANNAISGSVLSGTSFNKDTCDMAHPLHCCK